MTTGEVAKICNVAPRTVSKWFDSGQLRGYRIPGSKDRRIPVEQLRRFMRVHGIPLNGLETGETRVLILDADLALAEAAKRALQVQGTYQVATAESAFEAGALVNEFHPHVLIIDVMRPDVVSDSVVRWARSKQGIEDMGLIAVSSAMTDAAGQALLQKGFDGYLRKPFDVHSLVELIEDTTIRHRAHAQ